MSGRSPKQKGTRLERLVVAQFKGAGIEAKRMPLSGSVPGFEGDIIATLNGKDWRLECKSRARSPLYAWLEGRDAVVLKADRREPLITMRLADLLELLASWGQP